VGSISCPSPKRSRLIAGISNHGSFYAAQLAAIKLAGGDTDGAARAIKKYFDDRFPDQIARNGNQPLEWARARPFHYICFNLEAMIVSPGIILSCC
jgi:hypothetical protein